MRKKVLSILFIMFCLFFFIGENAYADIVINERINPEKFTSKRVFRFYTKNNKQVIIMSGQVSLLLRGESQWKYERVALCFKFPFQFPEGKMFKVINNTPLITLNNIDNTIGPARAGWGIKRFSISNTPIRGDFCLFTEIAIRGTNSKVRKLGYHITIKGEWVDYVEPDVIK